MIVAELPGPVSDIGNLIIYLVALGTVAGGFRHLARRAFLSAAREVAAEQDTRIDQRLTDAGTRIDEKLDAAAVAQEKRLTEITSSQYDLIEDRVGERVAAEMAPVASQVEEYGRDVKKALSEFRAGERRFARELVDVWKALAALGVRRADLDDDDTKEKQ